MGKPPRKPSQNQKAELALKMHSADQFYDVMRLVIKCVTWTVCILGCAYFMSRAFGRSTEVRFSGVVSLLGDLKFTATVTFAGSCAIWALVERALRKRVVKKLSPYKQAYEELLDKNRTSSTIAPDGTTNRRDRRE